MIKHCGPQFKVLLKLFNAVLDYQIWHWATSNVILLRKQGKDRYDLASSYRPITLSSYVGKLLEKIIEARLRLFCTNKGLIPSSQHGFRQGLSTATYICKLLQTVQHNVKSGLKVAALVLDLQKAFDTVWTEGLLAKLIKVGITGRILRLLEAFLKSRYVKLKVNNYTSNELHCNVGVPQGSVLSPLLFALYINDLLSDVIGEGLQYADDTTVIVSANTNAALEIACQHNCDKIESWLKKWRLMANSSKSELLLFNGHCAAPTIFGGVIATTNMLAY